ncbi:membrane protein [Marivirga tractuosa]|uniref:Membrane protein n=1 Tax=Marivirga tractuosa (strain ATCC 23168 / DSM 4126 / NBRC 15989 / NCIMB 1408 / VKM B-1430 / H-43) TaxID=643867 RepID=E4TNF8_MARTH|nr:PorP/SprF family type IX secretion system membrane protein [Marivirga tractuosa]ADR20415.1 putative membrane protein [Marivirga tractuosa DSM 4126]BDD15140.1 membrane protein [Marivirga tractuosa]
MKKIIIIIIIHALSIGLIKAQTNPLLGQYIQNLPAYNPSLAGVNDFLDINAGFRQQWVGFQQAPQTNYVSAYSTIKFDGDKERSDFAQSLKHGVGGFVILQNQGYYRQTEVSFTYAVHVPVFNETYFSLGLSPSFYNNKIDLSDLWVKDESTDETYQSVMENGYSNTFLHTNIGISLYSSDYYISYSLMEASELQLRGNEDTNNNISRGRHHIMGGYRFQINQDFDIIPNTFIRIDQARPTFYELGVRSQYQGNLWAGLSYRNDNTLVSMLGIHFKEKYKIGYAFEYKWGEVSQYNSGSHEVVLGIRLFDYNKAGISMW